ncbi:sugar nucleotide-binding protein [Hyalangium rubrum]|uniref:dTDP-4-dehydrorhamnose reductase n=1 Tax=Hyalangium rubrum TaxID=3103134 RepID=A0ABU5HB75_9BACT|nr:sugar nucleotide-binding protein [Hyalangium sp. s54d21]MDY7230377.1 sugar nucleotide-binding protein [Hyalangium sp. s54d21]
MRAVITGASGTVGTRLSAHLRQEGFEVIPWDRRRVPVDDYWAMERFVRETAPDVLFHLATASEPTGRPGESWLINYEWTSELAWITRTLGVRFVFSSTTLVFSNDARGPFTVDSRPDATEGYGYEKRRAEERAFFQNPEARVVRLGWQIGEQLTGNNMLAFLEDKMRQEGRVEASTRWYPACSPLEDTVRALRELAWAAQGLYMLDSNERWTFYEIARALSARHGNRWRVEPSERFVFDQRMRDERVKLPSLKAWLPELP